MEKTITMLLTPTTPATPTTPTPTTTRTPPPPPAATTTTTTGITALAEERFSGLDATRAEL